MSDKTVKSTNLMAFVATKMLERQEDLDTCTEMQVEKMKTSTKARLRTESSFAPRTWEDAIKDEILRRSVDTSSLDRWPELKQELENVSDALKADSLWLPMKSLSLYSEVSNQEPSSIPIGEMKHQILTRLKLICSRLEKLDHNLSKAVLGIQNSEDLILIIYNRDVCKNTILMIKSLCNSLI
ncbi:nonstructural protein 2 [Influenza C virus]|uniref:Nuclear export protein n=2 Tax=Influenza C virus TaxID=11552 RepID=Q784N9_9ORTO|nr:NS2 [Influenza C virus (C/Yamagata/1/88)]BAB12074.1 NS2 [Influenza C virus]BAB12076.1 NS2 [Influenza C virus]BAB12082.1 NS2 [Influenza C virus]BAB12090.1 NS2 [Influenza C virus]